METWLSDRIPFITYTPASGSTGGFETWLAERHPFLVYITAAASGAQTINANFTPSTLIIYRPTIAISNIAPVAAFTFEVDGRTLTLTNTSTDSDGTVERSVWDMGDGNTYDSDALTIPTPFSHTYASNGPFSITLTVTDNLGATDADIQSSGTLTPASRTAAPIDFVMPGANNQRSSRTDAVVGTGQHKPTWHMALDSYIPYYMQLVAINNVLFVPTAHGIEAVDTFGINDDEWHANNLSKPWLKWTFATAMPVGNAPTYYATNGFLYFGSLDSKLYCLDAADGTEEWNFQADSGIMCNPVAASVGGSDRVIFISRLGTVYSLDAASGALVWKTGTGIGQPVSVSPSLYGGNIYVVGSDNRVHKIVAATGAESWQSAVLSLYMHNFWVVPYTHPTSGVVRVIVSGGWGYRAKLDPGPQENTAIDGHIIDQIPHRMERDDVMPLGGTDRVIATTGDNPVNDQYFDTVSTWNEGTQGVALWADGQQVISATRIQEYFSAPVGGDAADGLDRFERKPWRKNIILLDDVDGTEAETLPVLMHGTKTGGRYPAVIGHDNLIYQFSWTRWRSIVRGSLCAYDLDHLDYVAEIQRSASTPTDEPHSFLAASGAVTYSGHGDYEIGAFIPGTTTNNIWVPNGTSAWIYAQCPNFNTGGKPGYSYQDSDGPEGAGNVYAFGGYDGSYGKHGFPAPPVPHDGKVYVLCGNAIICLAEGAPTLSSVEYPHVPVATRPSLAAAQPSEALLLARLEAHVQQAVDAGRLGPSYTPHFSLVNAQTASLYNNHIVPAIDFFHNPSETAVALIRARAFVSAGLQADIDACLLDMWTNYRPGAYEHVGYVLGVHRDNWLVLPADVTALISESPAATISAPGGPFDSGGAGTDLRRNPLYYYALWRYYNAGIDPSYTTTNALSHGGTLTTRVTDDDLLLLDPELLHATLAGYYGYIQLLTANGSSTTTAQGEYDRLLLLWETNFQRGSRYDADFAYAVVGEIAKMRVLNGSRHPMWLMPEIAVAYRANLLAGYTDAVDHYTESVIPYWMVNGFGVGYFETAISSLYDTTWLTIMHHILELDREQLSPYVDVPYCRGDLNYINNLSDVVSASTTLSDPVAGFTYVADTENGATITDTSSAGAGAAIIGHLWDFGDGTYSTSAVPGTHTYAASGDYTIVLRVTNSDGIYDEFGDEVTVAGPLPPTIDSIGHVLRTFGNGATFETEITISATVTTEAANPEWEYDASPPTGVPVATGISVEVVISSPSNVTYTLPLVPMQPFIHTTHADTHTSGAVHDHDLPAVEFYNAGTYPFAVRLRATETGSWSYYVQATDANGSDTSSTDSATVTTVGRGAIRVGVDTRLFAFEDGTYFPAFGYNLNSLSDWYNDPEITWQPEAELIGNNGAGVNFLRVWLSGWSTFGGSWNPVATQLPATDPPQALIRPFTTKEDRSLFWQIQPSDPAVTEFHSNGIVIGVKSSRYRISCEPSTTYEIKITYELKDAFTINPSPGTGSYGLVISTHTSVPSQANLTQTSFGTARSSYVTSGTSGVWTTLAGTYTTGAGEWFLPYVMISVKNSAYIASGNTTNRVYISDIEIREDLGGGARGVNLMSRYKADVHEYFDQFMAARFDRFLHICEDNGLYVSLVTMEKNDPVLGRFKIDGTLDTTTTPDLNDNFYGNTTDVDHHGRWYQKQWWRYCQARWGYSSAVHSWDLLNEGHTTVAHYRQADVLAGWINQWMLNRHLITTSFFTHRAFPRTTFWDSATYPNISASGLTFATTHDYVDETDAYWDDAAEAIADIETVFATDAGMPTGSGETDWRTAAVLSPEIDASTNAVWLHTYLWSQIGGRLAFVLPWWIIQHVMPSGSDQRSQFGAVRAFLEGLPIAAGGYAPLTATQTDLVVVGQVNPTADRAHFWVQAHGANPYTWKSIDDALTITPVTENVVINGLTPSQSYDVTEYNVTTGAATANTATVVANGSGVLTILTSAFASLVGLDDSVAFQVEEAEVSPVPNTYDTWLSDRLPLVVAGVEAGTYDTWLSDRLPLRVYPESSAIAPQVISANFTAPTTMIYAAAILPGALTINAVFMVSTAVIYQPTVAEAVAGGGGGGGLTLTLGARLRIGQGVRVG